MNQFFILIIAFSISLSSNLNTIKMEAFDVEAVLAEDQSRQPGTPERFAYSFNTDIDFFEEASVEFLDNDDRLWRLRIQSEEAIGMQLYFNEFYIPEGAYLNIFSEDMSEGPFDTTSNHIPGEFSHALIKGDMLTLEYYEPVTVEGSSTLNISNVYHAYKDILGFYEEDRDRQCGVNVACDEGEFSDQINSVIFLSMGGYICSAALINNTSFDLTPYVLTANHCLPSSNNDNVPGDSNYFTFYFKHQSGSCSGSSGNYNYARTGSTLRASYYYSDFALLEMTYSPPSSFDGYYAGWSKSSSSPTISAGIHHPGGAPKKINYDNDNAYSNGWYANNTHWLLQWDEGGTEGGSSGSPLFNDDKQIVGQLHGGSGECGSGNDLYGKLSTSWNGGGTSTTRLSDWLDPNNTGLTSISGTYNGEGGGGDPPEVTLLSPNGGEAWNAGESYQITWNDNFSQNVSLKLYKGNTFSTTIASSIESDGAYTWAIPSNSEYRDDYRIKITNVDNATVYDFSNSYFSINGTGSVNLDIESVNITSSGGSINISMENDTPVSGYQFLIADNPNSIYITSVADLTDSGFSASSSEEGLVIAFSFTGGTINPGSGLLLSADFETVEANNITLCLEEPVFSNPSSNPIPVTLGDCVDIELLQVMAGDVNLDGTVNVLDAVVLVNAVLNPSELTDTQFQAGDLNGDGVLNVLDVVIIVNIIINN